MAHAHLVCSFCGHCQSARRKLFAGPTVYVCDYCIGLCNDILEEDIPKELTGQSLMTFLQQHMGGRPVDSITVGELVAAYHTAADELLPKPEGCADGDAKRATAVSPLSPEERAALHALSEQYKIPAIDLSIEASGSDCSRLMSKEICAKYDVFPVSQTGSAIALAMADPTNLNAIDDVKFVTGCLISPVLAHRRQILEAVANATALTAGQGH